MQTEDMRSQILALDCYLTGVKQVNADYCRDKQHTQALSLTLQGKQAELRKAKSNAFDLIEFILFKEQALMAESEVGVDEVVDELRSQVEETLQCREHFIRQALYVNEDTKFAKNRIAPQEQVAAMSIEELTANLANIVKLKK